MNHKAILKSINRWARNYQPFKGGMQYGVDWNTWSFCYPQIAATFQFHAKEITGRDGYFMPIFR